MVFSVDNETDSIVAAIQSGDITRHIQMAKSQVIELQHLLRVYTVFNVDRFNLRQTQIVEPERATPVQYHGAFDDIFKLPYIAGPVVGH
jgi:hypothetical protein